MTEFVTRMNNTDYNFKCMQQQQDLLWLGDDCTQNEIINDDKTSRIQCFCKAFSPTTIMETHKEVFLFQEKNETTDASNMDMLEQFKFQGHPMFKVIIVLSGVLILCILYGFVKDYKDYKFYYPDPNSIVVKIEEDEKAP